MLMVLIGILACVYMIFEEDLERGWRVVYSGNELSFIGGVVRCIQRVRPGLRLYLAGNVVIVAESDDDLERFLYASTYPPYIEFEKVRELRNSFAVICTDSYVALADLKSFEVSLALSHVLIRALEPYAPYVVDGVDLIVSYRVSEDGGVYTRYEVRVGIKDRSRSSEVCQHVNTVLSGQGPGLQLLPL